MLNQRLKAQKQNARSPSPHSRLYEGPATSGVRLAQEIHDEFLVCKICLEAYKNPKCLNCLHTFCENCIENHVMSESTYKKYTDYREFTCPLCRKRTQLPLGGVKKLPDNFLVSSLTELVDRQKPNEFPFCDICKMVNKKHKEASSKCLDCSKLLCRQCVDLHKETKVTKNHSIFDMEIEKDIECKEHSGEVVRFYCEPCEMCVCILCTFNEHRDHEVSQFADAVALYKSNMQTLLEECKVKSEKFDNHISALSDCEAVIKQAEQSIHDTALEFIAQLRTREKQLVDDLRNLYGNDTIECIENKQDIGVTVDSLRNTCNLTEVILKGKDIELLLLKKEVQDKLSMLKAFEVKKLPDSIDKKIKFVAGKIDLGYLYDSDKPISSRLSMVSNAVTQTEFESKSDSEEESESEEEDDDAVETIDRGVQTVAEKELKSDDESEEEEEEEEEESDEEEPKIMKDASTETIPIQTEERAVNTRSRSLQPAGSKEDDSLAARRRRHRRERRTDLGQSLDAPDSPLDEDGRRRSRFSYHNSFEGDESFYDAAAEPNGQHYYNRAHGYSYN